MRSWEVRLAVALAWLGVLPGLACGVAAVAVLKADPGFLFAVLPAVAGGLLLAAVVLLTGAVQIALQLQRGHPQARLQTALVGGTLAFVGLLLLAVFPGAGVPLALYGGTLLFLMSTDGAAQDLGPWRRALREPAPWGTRPGTRLWAPATPAPGQHPDVASGPVQGPWAPDPRTLPWLSWKDHSGPRAPWWQTWQAGLAQGIPLWELVLLCLALLAFLVGLVAIPVVLAGSAYLGTLHARSTHGAALLLLLPSSGLVVAWLERRMRVRLATRPSR